MVLVKLRDGKARYIKHEISEDGLKRLGGRWIERLEREREDPRESSAKVCLPESLSISRLTLNPTCFKARRVLQHQRFEVEVIRYRTRNYVRCCSPVMLRSPAKKE